MFQHHSSALVRLRDGMYLEAGMEPESNCSVLCDVWSQSGEGSIVAVPGPPRYSFSC